MIELSWNAGAAILPPPEGRGLTRILVIAGDHVTTSESAQSFCIGLTPPSGVNSHPTEYIPPIMVSSSTFLLVGVIPSVSSSTFSALVMVVRDKPVISLTFLTESPANVIATSNCFFEIMCPLYSNMVELFKGVLFDMVGHSVHNRYQKQTGLIDATNTDQALAINEPDIEDSIMITEKHNTPPTPAESENPDNTDIPVMTEQQRANLLAYLAAYERGDV